MAQGIVLRSPFNGGNVEFPPETATPEFVAELLKRGFSRVEPVKVKPTKTKATEDAPTCPDTP